MYYFKDLPNISYEASGKRQLIEFEVGGKIERLQDDDKQQVVFLGKMGQTVYLIMGTVAEFEYVPAKDALYGCDFTRIKMKGHCMAFS